MKNESLAHPPPLSASQALEQKVERLRQIAGQKKGELSYIGRLVVVSPEGTFDDQGNLVDTEHRLEDTSSLVS
jgi:hypothetical protein